MRNAGKAAQVLIHSSCLNSFVCFFFKAVMGIASLHNWQPVILHRDVKSLNFLVDAFWNIKVRKRNGLQRSNSYCLFVEGC